jgi:pilus assembly protein CpaC
MKEARFLRLTRDGFTKTQGSTRMVTKLAANAARRLLAAVALSIGCSGLAYAQNDVSQPVHFRVEGESQRLEMIVNTSRILTLEHNVPRLLVNNPEIVRASPLSPNQIQISAVKAGVTQVNVWDDRQQVHSIDVVVMGDARELENLLKSEFPEASLRIRPLSTSVVVSGYVPNAEMVSRIVRMAEDYYQNVINNMTVGGVQQVNLHVKVMEVSRTKLRALGIDWAVVNGDDFIVSGAAGLANPAAPLAGVGGDVVRWGLVTQPNSLATFIEAMRRDNLVKILAEPTLTTVSGRPASFNSGGEFPVLVPQSLGTVSVEYREFGTRIDFVPIVLGNGNIRLEVRPQISELDPSQSVNINNFNVPGLRTRWVDTGVEMKAGQTLALAGLIQTRQEAENRGIPVLADLPWIGAAFRRVEHRNNEIELVITVTPEFCEALDPEEVPPCGPGERTTAPDDCDVYGRGYLEVPVCCGKCADGSCASCQNGASAPAGVIHEEVAPPAGSKANGDPLDYGPAPVPPPAADGVRRAPARQKSQALSHRPTTGGRASRDPRRSSQSASAARSAQPSRSASGDASPRWMQPAKARVSDRQTPGEPGLIGPIGYEAIR